MGRPKGAKNRPKDGQISDEAMEIEASGDNVTTLPVVRVERFEDEPKGTLQQLSDAQRESLFHQHSKAVNRDLAALKKAKAQYDNTCKLAKAEMGADAMFRIKLGAILESQEGEDKKKAELAATIEVASWVGSSIGTQLRMFDAADGVPLGMRAYESGRRAGLKGDKAKPPSEFSSGEGEQQWLSGHADGNAELATKTFKPFAEVAEEGDAVIRDADASRQPSYQVIN